MPFFGKVDISKLEQKRDINGLIKIEKQNDIQLREQAAEALGRIGRDAVFPIIDDLRRTPFTGTVEVSYMDTALGRIGEPAIEPLISAIKEKNIGLRINAMVALGCIGAPAINPLINLFADPDADVRGLAAAALGRIGQPSVAPLIQTLTDPRDEVRLSAVVALGAISDKRAIEPLRKTLSDNNRWVRLHSAGALARMDKSENQAMDILRGATQDYAPDSNDDYRKTAALFLQQITAA